MGLKLGRFLKKTTSSLLKRAPAIVGGFAAGGPAGAFMGLASSVIAKAQSIGAGIPSSPFLPGQPSLMAEPVVQTNGGLAVPALGTVPQVGALGIRFMTKNAALAIMKLARIFGIGVVLSNLASVGRRLWRMMMVFARRHPAISVLSMLTALGLTVEEGAEFMLWGEATKRKRRGRGISARDIRTCRRTMRRMASFQRDLFRAAPRRRGALRGTGGPIIAQN